MKDDYNDSKTGGISLVIKELNPYQNLTHTNYNVEERMRLFV